jgi:hypothetical protein
MITSCRELDHSAARVASLPFSLGGGVEKILRLFIVRAVTIFVVWTLANRASLALATFACSHIMLNALGRNKG